MLNNFRNVSGSNKIWRSATIYGKGLTDEEKAQLDSLGLDKVFDLRCKSEARERPDYIPSGATYVRLNTINAQKYRYVLTDLRSRILAGHLVGPFEYKLKKNKFDSYPAIADSPVWAEVFAAMDRGEKFLFHCTEGKDRTGFCSVIIEHCLGIDDDTIMQNYLVSNELRPPKNRQNLKKMGFSQRRIDDIKYAETTHEELLLHAYNFVNEKYGNLDQMLLRKFDVTEERKARWKEIYCDTD